MKIKEYQVIAPAGVVWNENIVVQGGTITAPTADGRIKAYLHFRQVRENAVIADAPVRPADASAALAPAVGALNLEPGQAAALVNHASAELPAVGTPIAPMSGGEFVAAPVGVAVREAADDPAAELGEAEALARAKRKSIK